MKFVWVGLIVLSGCLHNTSLQVLRPADVALPPHIQSIAVVDRSAPANARERIIGTTEGMLTNEDIAADRHGAQVAVNAVADTLRASPRFTVNVPPPNPRRQDSTVFDRAMSFRVARDICRPYSCTAVVALETFDSNSDFVVGSEQETYTDDEGRERHRRLFTATRDTRVVASWRIYDLKRRDLVDDIRDYAAADSWTAEGATEREALAGLPPSYDAVQAVGASLGRSYGVRIAPTWIWVNRSWFGSGSPELRSAKNYVRAGDWDGAAEIWRTIAERGGRDGAKATFNLAVYNETLGRLDLAVRRATEAAVQLPRALTRRYVATLQRRQLDEQRLREQLGE